MSLWYDRRSYMDGPGVHALIIGVSDYQFLPQPNAFPSPGRETLGLTKVQISAVGAFRFAEWLKDRYWHPHAVVKTIRLLLSASKEEVQAKPELAAVASTQPRATTDEVWKALQEWQNDCKGNPEDIAILYVAGHGIQWGSKDDAIVLLEDFSKDSRFLNHAIDIGKTSNGMSGDTMPQTQFYFVDACRIQPVEFPKFKNAGEPLCLPSDYEGADLRSAPIYYAACPQTKARGYRGEGTYFAQALVECLDLLAHQGPDRSSQISAAQSHWHVSVLNLLEKLQSRTKEVAGARGEKQDVVMGGAVRPAVICAAPYPPRVDVVISIDPPQAAACAFAELRDWSQRKVVKDLAPCAPRPLVMTHVQVGLYVLMVSASDPYRPHHLFSVDVRPPEWNEPVNLK